MPDQHVVTENLPIPVKWNPPSLSGGIQELEHTFLTFPKVDESRRDPLNLGAEPVKEAQL